MKKFIKFFPPVVIAVAMAAMPTAMADSAKSITVTNNTTYTMTELYPSSTNHSADWTASPNILSGQSIGPGQSMTVSFSDGTSYCHYDFMAILYGAAQAGYTYSVNTCDGNSAHWAINP